MQHRLTIYAKDVSNLTGRQRNASYKLLGRIKRKFNIGKDALVTIEQFCGYTGFKREDVIKYLRET